MGGEHLMTSDSKEIFSPAEIRKDFGFLLLF